MYGIGEQVTVSASIAHCLIFILYPPFLREGALTVPFSLHPCPALKVQLQKAKAVSLSLCLPLSFNSTSGRKWLLSPLLLLLLLPRPSPSQLPPLWAKTQGRCRRLQHSNIRRGRRPPLLAILALCILLHSSQ